MATIDDKMRVNEAKHKLSQAIADYCQDIGSPYVMDWLIVTHLETTESERAGKPIFGIITAADQNIIISRGLLDIAYNQWRP